SSGVVGQLPLNRLKLADRLAKRPSLLRVRPSGLVGALREPDRQCGDADASGIEHLHAVHESMSLFAEQLVGWNPAVIEQDLARVRGAHAKLVFFLSGRHSASTAFDDEGGDSFRSGGAVR